MLKRGAMKCYKDRSKLHWHQVAGMRLYRERRDGVKVYDARCPQCGTNYEVRK